MIHSHAQRCNINEAYFNIQKSLICIHLFLNVASFTLCSCQFIITRLIWQPNTSVPNLIRPQKDAINAAFVEEQKESKASKGTTQAMPLVNHFAIILGHSVGFSYTFWWLVFLLQVVISCLAGFIFESFAIAKALMPSMQL